jgi:hypothetical protein
MGVAAFAFPPQQEVPIVPEVSLTAGSQDHCSKTGEVLTNDLAPVFDGPDRVTPDP